MEAQPGRGLRVGIACIYLAQHSERSTLSVRRRADVTLREGAAKILDGFLNRWCHATRPGRIEGAQGSGVVIRSHGEESAAGMNRQVVAVADNSGAAMSQLLD